MRIFTFLLLCALLFAMPQLALLPLLVLILALLISPSGSGRRAP